jgi:hypothetical protein
MGHGECITNHNHNVTTRPRFEYYPNTAVVAAMRFGLGLGLGAWGLGARARARRPSSVTARRPSGFKTGGGGESWCGVLCVVYDAPLLSPVLPIYANAICRPICIA